VHDERLRNTAAIYEDGGLAKEYRYDGRGNLTEVLENSELTASFTWEKLLAVPGN